eukprot:CAMPEP_0171348812 /NCGR_PEP_ID=MMETSP0878-20121228/31948_1 /TAXON_ID=67004 /ORGANISM="Thalassiosira weissflogii, Strain CCMP1336" /LENGTH=65 /DNA_ID=CAMNT_0011853273 /DNA_START=49 /DNA_END=243 /DNA_ORIENTATION=+
MSPTTRCDIQSSDCGNAEESFSVDTACHENLSPWPIDAASRTKVRILSNDGSDASNASCGRCTTA